MMLFNTDVIYSLPDTLDPRIFRAYDIRAVVGAGFGPEVVYGLGRAIGTRVIACGQRQIILGYDGRVSAPSLAPALLKGLMDCGLQVLNVGQVPTPVMYFATQHLQIPAGVMLTASHNPGEYNGLKIMLENRTLSAEEISGLYDEVLARDFAEGEGHHEVLDVQQAYRQRICDDVKLQRPLKIVVDAGNGVAGPLAVALYRQLGCEVIPLHCEVDGRFPNHEADPSQAENLTDLVDAVKAHNADLGIALDGDGDRLGVVTEQGEIIWPDRQLMLYAKDVLSRNPKARILFDVKCTRHLATVIEQHGGEAIMWKTGHSLVKAHMATTGALLAGEMSGHIFYKERWFGFDDGLYSGCRLLEILASQSESAHSLFAKLPNSINTPELKIPMEEEEKFDFVRRFIETANFEFANLTTLDGLRADFPDGWGLVRSSNTSPYLILRFEADTAPALARIQALFRQQLLKLSDNLQLPF